MTEFPKAGVIGNPISHSLSPKLHAHWRETLQILGGYTAFQVGEAGLEHALRQFADDGFAGLNVTLPHKVNVLSFATRVTDRARSIGAANTLTFLPDGGFEADNTDGYGFMANLYQRAPNWDPTSGPAAVFGAGGAARAILYSLIAAGVPEIYLANRTIAKAEALRDEFGATVTAVNWEAAASVLPKAQTVINTTSLGMKGADAFSISLDALNPTAVVTDIVYTPLETPFLLEAKKQGCQTVDGLGMLLHQGVPGFERWFGKRPEVTQETRDAVLS